MLQFSGIQLFFGFYVNLFYFDTHFFKNSFGHQKRILSTSGQKIASYELVITAFSNL
jgi:hypothetical protein